MADISKFDYISKLQVYEDYIANNIAEWESESIARVCRKIGEIGRMSKKELEKFDADKEAKKEWERIVAALAIATALNIRTIKKAYISEFEAWEKQNEYWSLLLKWDNDSPVTFKADGHTVHDYDRRFQLEDELLIPIDRPFRWSMLEEDLQIRLM